ncbi:hypothetical protein L6255_00970 [Candidatus Parcubacteria bacterium]|nr:hypothetical protein [Patescibacteria group bacterium]MBU4381276.1 hypothetical protein [Patescibacteria group bacterium]MCG2688993.1 hypothetical protein [Candidatus Parcubacteria bacterium]
MPKKTEILTKEYFDATLETKLDSKLEQKLSPFREDIRKIYDTLDWLVGAFKKFDEEHTFHSSRIYGHEEQLENHEVRIGVLEKKAT